MIYHAMLTVYDFLLPVKPKRINDKNGFVHVIEVN